MASKHSHNVLYVFKVSKVVLKYHKPTPKQENRIQSTDQRFAKEATYNIWVVRESAPA